MPVSTLTQHQHGEPDSPESVCGGTLVGGEDDDERASEPARVKRVGLSHNSLQWRLARRARRQPLQLPQCLLTACRRRRCGSAILGKSSDRSAQVLSAVSAAGATYLSGCTITRRSREAGSERRRDVERGGKWSFSLWVTSPVRLYRSITPRSRESSRIRFIFEFLCAWWVGRSTVDSE